VQHAAFEAVADVGDRARGVYGIAEIDLDVVLRAGIPRTIFRERMPRSGDDAPTRRRKADHRGMADAAARSGEK
jgi:hypothetical protein